MYAQAKELAEAVAENGAMRGTLTSLRELAISRRDLAAEAGDGDNAMHWGRVVRQVDNAFSVIRPASNV